MKPVNPTRTVWRAGDVTGLDSGCKHWPLGREDQLRSPHPACPGPWMPLCLAKSTHFSSLPQPDCRDGASVFSPKEPRSKELKSLWVKNMWRHTDNPKRSGSFRPDTSCKPGTRRPFPRRVRSRVTSLRMCGSGPSSRTHSSSEMSPVGTRGFVAAH